MIFNPQAKLLWHGSKVEEWLHTGRIGPILVEIAPVGYCNANCSWCFCKRHHSNKRVNGIDMLNAIEDLSILGVKAINWTGGGEPTLHPKFDKFIAEANVCGLHQGLFTNGYQEIPHQDMFSWIRISLTDKGFKRIKKPDVPFGICLNHIKKYSEVDLENFCIQAKRFGASYFQIRPALTGSYKRQPELIPPKFFEKYETNKFKVYITDYKYEEATKPKDYKYCYGYHFCPSIDWKGDVSACLYLSHKEKFAFGNIQITSLMDIWPRIPEKIRVIPECQNCCKNHEINRILYRAKNVTLQDFI